MAKRFYERKRRRTNGIVAIRSVAHKLARAAYYMLETKHDSMRPDGKKRGPAPKLLKQIEQISQLPKSKQKFVMDMLDTVIQQAAH